MTDMECGRCGHERRQHKDYWHCLLDDCPCTMYSQLEHCSCGHPIATHSQLRCHAAVGTNLTCDCQLEPVKRTRKGTR